MRRVRALAVVFVICLCLAARAEDSISGTWRGTANSPQGTVEFTLTLTLSESSVTGTITSDTGSEAISDGKFDGETLSFATSYNGMSVAMSAKLTDGKLAGTFNVNGGEAAGDWQATRTP